MKKLTVLLAALMLASTVMTGLFGCSGGGNKNSKGSENETMEEKTVMTYTTDGNDYLMQMEGYTLQFKYDAGYSGYSIDLLNTEKTITKITFQAEHPVKVYVLGSNKSVTYYENKYTSISINEDSLTAVCEFTTDGGANYKVTDVYSGGVKSFRFDRTCKVTKKVNTEVGFQTEFAMFGAETSYKYANFFDRFVPSLVYKNNKEMRSSGNLLYSTDSKQEFVRETLATTPMAMAHNNVTGNTVTVQHVNPEISAPYGGGTKDTASNDYQYGTIGYYYGDVLGLGYCFPVRQETTTKFNLYTPADDTADHSYSINIIPDKNSRYSDAMVYSYKKAFSNENPPDKSMDIDLVYQQNIDIFNAYYEEYSNGSQKVGGVPFSITLPAGTQTTSMSDGFGAFAGGFVGQQVPIGYQLLQYGYDKNDNKTLGRGKTIIDFWTSSKIMDGNVVPVIWWDARNNSNLGGPRSINRYLRYLTDIPEGLLDAYICAESHGDESAQWYSAVISYANMFLNLQNEDGSWYRCYNANGSVCPTASSSDPYGESKLNTYMPVRFLGKVYELTGDEKYKDAALEAAEFAYENCYIDDEKYCGGTADNANIIDKEAAVYAMYCFNTAYELETNKKMKEKYYKAAEHAAVSAMSWTYIYDYAIPNQANATNIINPFENKGVMGFSVIGTGVTGGDNYNNYIYYELYKMYLKRNNDVFYKNSAILLQNASKYCSDFDGRLGYGKPGFMPEASRVYDFKFGSVNVWLPWSGIANIEPMINMKKVFGTMDILKIKDDTETQLKILNKYGIGGNLLG